ncbi:unnamed protein product [Scytosiphon promiscuus]
MEKAQLELFQAIRSGDLEKAQKAYDKGANVNWPLDRWMAGGRQHWGLRVQVKPLGIYLGFSARESWKVPEGEGADRGDTLVMVALKCRKQEEAVFLLGCDRLNPNCLNEAGNSVVDIARATGQEFLLRGRWGSVNVGIPTDAPSQQQQGEEYLEERPAWERQQGAAGGVQYASVVVAEAAPSQSGGKGTATETPVFATAEPVGEVQYGHPTAGYASAAPVNVATPMNTNDNPTGQGGRGRDTRPRAGGTLGTGAFGSF